MNVFISSRTNGSVQNYTDLFDGNIRTYVEATAGPHKKASITIALLKTYHVTTISIYNMWLTESCGATRPSHPCLPSVNRALLTGCRNKIKGGNSTIQVRAFRDTRSKSNPVYSDSLDLGGSNKDYDFTLSTSFIGNRIVLDRDTDTGGILISDIVLVGTHFGEN